MDYFDVPPTSRRALMPYEHDAMPLKTDPDVFQLSWIGKKPWEIRLDDRAYETGKHLCLCETVFTGQQMSQGAPLAYTGRTITAEITYVHANSPYGLAPAWVILSVEIRHLHNDHMPEIQTIGNAIDAHRTNTQSVDGALDVVDAYIKYAAHGRDRPLTYREQAAGRRLSVIESLDSIERVLTEGVSNQKDKDCERCISDLRHLVNNLGTIHRDTRTVV